MKWKKIQTDVDCIIKAFDNLHILYYITALPHRKDREILMEIMQCSTFYAIYHVADPSIPWIFLIY